MGKKESAAVALDLEYETFVVHVASLSSNPLNAGIYLSRKLQIASWIVEKTFSKISAKYADFANVFSPDLASKLPKYTWINDYTIKLIDGQQPPYRPIYSLGPVELETLKAYIGMNLANKYWRRRFKLSMATMSTKWCISSPLTVLTYGLHLKDLLECRQPSGWNFSVQKNVW